LHFGGILAVHNCSGFGFECATTFPIT
jgi:hypothetical protein